MVVIIMTKIRDFKFFKISLNGILETAIKPMTNPNIAVYATDDFAIRTATRKNISDIIFILGSVR
jgi:hypothetical protein